MKLLKKLTPEQQTSPQMLCVLGDVKKDPSYYEQAWEKSNHRLSRAQRSIAKYHFYRQEFDLAIPAFEKCLRLNRLDINSLSNLGYIYMSKGNEEKAIECYSSIICLDENQSMAWANLAIMYRKLGKMKEAFKTCQKAASKNERNYQMLMNLQNISFDCKEYNEFVRSTLKIIQLEKAEVLKEVIFQKLNYIMELLYQTSEDNPSKIRSTEINYTKIEQIYMIMVKKFPLRQFLWIQLLNFIELEKNLLDLKRKEKMKAEKESRKVHFFNPLNDYQKDLDKLVNKKYAVMQKRIHAQMKIGWQENLDNCKEVLTLVEEHNTYFKTNIGCFTSTLQKKYMVELKMQIDTVHGFIKKINEK